MASQWSQRYKSAFLLNESIYLASSTQAQFFGSLGASVSYVVSLLLVLQPEIFTDTLEGLFMSVCYELCPTLQPDGLQPPRLLCPWDSPGKNTGVGCHALLRGIFPTQ